MNKKADVIGIHGASIPAEQVFRYAIQYEIEEVVVVGKTPDGNFYIASSESSPAEVTLKLQKGIKFILDNFA